MRNKLLFYKRYKKQLRYSLVVLLFFSFSSLFSQEVTVNKYAVENDTECNQFDVTLEIIGNPPPQPQEVVIVIDRSGSMDDGAAPLPITYAKDAAIDFVDNFFLASNNPNGLNKIAVVSYAYAATIDIGLTGITGKNAIITAINNIVTGGNTNIEDAMVKADGILTSSGTFNCNTSRNIILLSDGAASYRNINTGEASGTNLSCNPNAANSDCRAEGIQAGIDAQTTTVGGVVYTQNIFSIGLVGAITDPEQTYAVNSLNSIQNSGSYITENNADLSGIYSQILGKLVPAATQLPGQSLVSNTIANGFSLVPGTINTATGTTTVSGDQISWFVNNLYKETITLNYSIVADNSTTCGVQDVGNSVMNYEDSDCAIATKTFSNPAICVPCPEIDPQISRVACTNSIEYTSNVNQGGCTAVSNSYQWVFSLNGTQVGTSNTQNGTFNYTGTPAFEGSFTANLTYNGSYGNGTCSITDVNKDSNTLTLPPALVATITTKTNVSCNSEATGNIDINVTGGTEPYSYLWNDANNSTTQDLTSVIAGAYNVTITDALGCTTSIGATITEPNNPLSLNISKVDATTAQGCTNGQATAIISGGTPSYSYQWSASAGSVTTATATGLSNGTHSVTVTDANGCQLTQSVVIECVNTCDAEIDIVNITDVLCTGDASGSGTVNANSGANPSATFTFTWSNGQVDAGVKTSSLSSLVAGVYSVSVTIDGTVCQAVEETISITEPSNALNVSATTTDEKGPVTGDGTATSVVTGGVEPYTYAWSPGGQNTSSITGLSAGDYTVTVTDANGCTDSTTVTVNPGTCLNLSVTGTSTPALCFGDSNGSVTATVTGGSGNFTYAWDTIPNTTAAVSNLPAGDYTITVTDSITLCTTNTTITINEPNILSSGIAVTNILCRDDATGSLDLAVNGGTFPYTFLWSNGATTEDLINVVSGTYSVTITDKNGCTTSKSATIVQPSTNISASITSQTDVDCLGNTTGEVTVEAVGGISPYTYSIDNGTNYSSSGTFTGLAEGSYIVIVLDANGCTFDQNVEINTVVDITNPTITCPADVTSILDSGTCSTDSATIDLGTPTTSDNCLVASVNNDAPSTYPLGETIVTWTVTDGLGNTATCEQKVIIIDNTVPTIVTCAAPVSVNVDANGCTTDIANINLGTPTVDDNCTTTTITNDAPDTFPLGDTIVTWTVTDGSNNSVTCEQTVTVIDNIEPSFVTCAAPVSVNVDANGCTTDIANINLGTPTVEDNCTTTTITNDAPDTFPLGETIVTWTVTDGSNNSVTCEQIVTVIDNIEPSFVSCAAPVSVNVDANGCTTDIANINLGTPTVEDNCTT
ncbi:HYR domain-containing protein, partial [Algibacter sp.]|uniref:HYR domain-containing protein n=1 Tax=Algibacter sp. TaxID=1872428 RepID=UPI003C721E5E